MTLPMVMRLGMSIDQFQRFKGGQDPIII